MFIIFPVSSFLQVALSVTTSQYGFCCTEEVQLAEAFAKKEEMVGNLLNLKKNAVHG